MLTTLSVLSLDQGKISPSQFDDRRMAEAHVTQVDPWLAENQSRDLQAPSRLNPGLAHVLRWMLAMFRRRLGRSGVQTKTAGGKIAPA